MKFRSFVMALACTAALIGLDSLARAEFIPIVGFDQQLFPSHIIATASIKTSAAADDHRLGDPRGVLGVKVVCPKANTPVTVAVECNDFIESSVFSGTLANAGETYTITPKIKFQYKKLAQCDQSAPTSVTFRVQLGKEFSEQTVTCTMRSINDCPFAYADGEKHINISETFAAYVNEQHPFVDKLLREALDIGIVDAFTGYQAGNEAEVLRQAYSLWDLLWTRDIRYSSITTSAASSNVVAAQHVRLIEESINNSQANCVDGSVLWVSLLRKIGIDAVLILEPGRCYAGFFAGEGRTNFYAIETTLVGVKLDPRKVKIPAVFSKAVPKDDRNAESFASFVAAVTIATDKFNKHVEQAEAVAQAEEARKNSKRPAKKQGQDDETDANSDADAAQPVKKPELRVIDIAIARQAGILPIGFQSKADFVWQDYTAFLDDEEETDEESDDEADSEDEDWSDDEDDWSDEDDSDNEDADSEEEDEDDSEDEEEDE